MPPYRKPYATQSAGTERLTAPQTPAPSFTRYLPPAGISLLLASGTVWLGKEIREEPFTERIIISGGFIILSIAYINLFSHSLANGFALLIFIAVVLKYGLDILSHTGLREE
jgi:hypothetical protein